MARATIAACGTAALLVLFAVAASRRAAPEQGVDPAVAHSETLDPAVEPHPGLLRGRVTTEDGTVYEGRLRFGGDEEALWGNYFNGYEAENPWSAYAPRGARRALEIFGLEIGFGGSELSRPFMARFGDIARIDARGRDLRVTLRSGTVVELDRYAADDFADGVRVWDGRQGVVDLDEWRVRTIELLPAAPGARAGGPAPLRGTVRTREGDFTGLVQWDREACLVSDVLYGHTDEGEVRLRFDAVRSIARRTGESALVTLVDGREIVLSDTRRGDGANRGMYVDDPRYGRVLVSWEAFESLELSSGGTGPAYSDFPPGRPLEGSVTTRSGRRLTGRLVYDLDESETTETLDAPRRGVDYTIPFALVASIEPGGRGSGSAADVRVTLHDGDELALERAGDLADTNAGLLVFGTSQGGPEYVPWADVERIDLDPQPAG